MEYGEERHTGGNVGATTLDGVVSIEIIVGVVVGVDEFLGDEIGLSWEAYLFFSCIDFGKQHEASRVCRGSAAVLGRFGNLKTQKRKKEHTTSAKYTPLPNMWPVIWASGGAIRRPYSIGERDRTILWREWRRSWSVGYHATRVGHCRLYQQWCYCASSRARSQTHTSSSLCILKIFTTWNLRKEWVSPRTEA